MVGLRLAPDMGLASFAGLRFSSTLSSRPSRASSSVRLFSRRWRCNAAATTVNPDAPPAAAPRLAACGAQPASEIRQIQRQLAAKERSASEVLGEYLARLEAAEPRLRSFLHVATESAMAQAAAIDAALANGEQLGPLAGVPIAVKDNLCVRGMPATAGSRILEGYVPPYDATAIRRLREAGAVIVGKTNMDEFGMGSSTEASGFQVTSNPWDEARVPGGSSGGSAAAVAARQCAAALGSDTGGSVRQPAAFCGAFGLKPTYGRISRSGLIAYASSLDVVGVVSRSAEDAAIILESVAGHDSADSTSSRHSIPSYAAALTPRESFTSRPLQGLRFGLVAETMGAGVEPGVVRAVRQAAEHLESLGATVTEVSLPTFAAGLPAYYTLAPSEASSNLARYDGVRFGRREEGEELASMYGRTRNAGFGEEVKRRILTGTFALSSGYYDAYYKRAQQVRTLIQRDFSRALEGADALISPAAPTVAFKKGEKLGDPLSMYAGDLMTVNVNLAGLPAVVLPCGVSQSEEGSPALPVGLQMIGPAFCEERILKYAHVFQETMLDWATRMS